jgi:hypothetical protein
VTALLPVFGQDHVERRIHGGKPHAQPLAVHELIIGGIQPPGNAFEFGIGCQKMASSRFFLCSGFSEQQLKSSPARQPLCMLARTAGELVHQAGMKSAHLTDRMGQVLFRNAEADAAKAVMAAGRCVFPG